MRRKLTDENKCFLMAESYKFTRLQLAEIIGVSVNLIGSFVNWHKLETVKDLNGRQKLYVVKNKNMRVIINQSDKDFVNENKDTMSVKQMSDKLDLAYASISKYCREEKITPLGFRQVETHGQGRRRKNDVPHETKEGMFNIEDYKNVII